MGTRQLDTGTGYIFVAVFNSNNNACDSENKTSASDVPKVGFQVNVILVWLFSYIFFSVHHRVEGAFDNMRNLDLEVSGTTLKRTKEKLVGN